MTSPVDTSVKFIHSTQSGAPVLNGTAGALISVLDALLVTGWGLQTAASVTVAGGVATVTFGSTFPAVVDSVVLIDGSSIAALNGEQKVTAVGSNSISFATAAADGSASGTITAKMAPAGWAKPFSGTNKAAYKSSDPTANGMYLRVDDTGATAARVVGYEQMIDIDTGTGPFPSDAQRPGGGYWCKSSTGQSNANGYIVVADSRFLIVHFCPLQYANPAYVCGNTHGFGDQITSRASGDAFATILHFAPNDGGTLSAASSLDGSSGSGCALPRDYTGLGSSVLRPRRPVSGASAGWSGNDNTWGAFPSFIDGRLMLSRITVAQDSAAPARCTVPGLYYVPQNWLGASFTRGSRVPGSGALSGRTLAALCNVGGAGSNLGVTPSGASFVDITGPWR